jgi:L-threonylcarbamoyladenylate synthase
MKGTDIEKAVALLKAGEVVALPTETVYGLAGNALAPAAVAKIFEIKQRPQKNPLIVHVTNMRMVRSLGLEVTDLAEELAEAFWPGPLTMVLRKSETSEKSPIPPNVNCGLDSVAVRSPSNYIMREIIRLCGFPLAAPSANVSGSPSPTAAKHVRDDLGGKIPLIVDGGSCEVGIESTVIMFDKSEGIGKQTGSPCRAQEQPPQRRCSEVIRILRPGVVTPEELSEFAEVVIDTEGSPLSPGTRYKHYAPKAEVIAVDGEVTHLGGFTLPDPDARSLYAKFREFDKLGANQIYVKLPEKSGVGLALYNRIIRAANFNVIKV